MIARRGALLLGIFVLAFISVTLVADILTGTNVSSVIGGVYSQNTATQTQVPADVSRCKCTYNSDFQQNTCNNFCGDLKGAACQAVEDCLV